MILLLIKGIPTVSVTVLRSVNQPVATEMFLELFTEPSKIPQLLNEENKHTHTPSKKHWKTPVLMENLKVRSFLYGSYWDQPPVVYSLFVHISPTSDWLDYPVWDSPR